MILVDTHCHIEMKAFNRDRPSVVRRARDAGILKMVAVGIDLEDSRRAVALAAEYEDVYAVVGIHPHDAKTIDENTYDALRTLAGSEKVVAYGEIGLDFFRNLSPKALQLRRFREQLDLADDLNLPVVIHDRDAHGDTLGILKNWKGGRTDGNRGIIHCFSGDVAMAEACVDLGFHISIPGTITFKNTVETRDVVRKIPMDRLLIETDAPFLTPQPRRGERNEPAHMVYTALKIAEIRGMEPEELGQITSRNAERIFHFPVFS